MSRKAIVLLSGGLDSTTVLALVLSQGYIPVCISFDYGQRHRVELEAAKCIMKYFQVQHHIVVKLELRDIGGSVLTSDSYVENQSDFPIPATYVPARNTIFLSYALAYAEVLRITEIFMGVNQVDYSGYPDCRPEYIDAFQKLANLATREGVTGVLKFQIQTPLMNLSKTEIIRLGQSLGVDYSMTHSCYDPTVNGDPCGCCDSCNIRNRAFEELRSVSSTYGHF
jgi:7-cyano-7-deazaguanine synthase